MLCKKSAIHHLFLIGSFSYRLSSGSYWLVLFQRLWCSVFCFETKKEKRSVCYLKRENCHWLIGYCCHSMFSFILSLRFSFPFYFPPRDYLAVFSGGPFFWQYFLSWAELRRPLFFFLLFFFNTYWCVVVAISHRHNGIRVSLCFNRISHGTKCWLIRQGLWRGWAKWHRGLPLRLSSSAESGACSWTTPIVWNGWEKAKQMRRQLWKHAWYCKMAELLLPSR